MKKILVFFTLILSFNMSCKPKLKIFNHQDYWGGKKIPKDNFYIKDEIKLLEKLKGKWIWTNEIDTLILQSTPIYKKEYDSTLWNYKNAYKDFSKVSLKYIKDGNIIVDHDDSDCFIMEPKGVYTNLFRMYNYYCSNKLKNSPVLILVRGKLVLVNNFWEEEEVFFKKGEKEVVLPRVITLTHL